MLSFTSKDLNDFFNEVFFKYAYDFREYNQSTMKRRIQLHAINIKISTFLEYTKKVLDNKTIFNGMFSYLCIHVTEFFREAKHLEVLKEKVFPYLETFSHLKIWYPACSSGENAYSLAIMLDEFNLLHKSQIYATDFNDSILSKAKNANYSFDSLAIANKNYKEYSGKISFDDYIIKKDKTFTFKDYIKEKVLFFNHNLVCDNVINEFNLIICQNVFIYFNNNLKKKVCSLFDNSLCNNGFLIIGKKEYLSSECLISFKEYENDKRVYQKCK